MNRDAKIGIVVILIIVGLLVVIWGRGGGRKDRTEGEEGAGQGQLGAIPPDGGVPPPPVPTIPPPPVGPPPVGPPPPPVFGTTTPGTAAPQYITYKVKPGDSLETIVRDQLHVQDPAAMNRLINEIVKLNNLRDKNKIAAGQTLKLPKEGASTPALEPAAPPVTSSDPWNEVVITAPSGMAAVPIPGATIQRRYVVKAGDNLMKIAREQLHAADDAAAKKLATKIAELNKLSNPDELEIGQALMLPE